MKGHSSISADIEETIRPFAVVSPVALPSLQRHIFKYLTQKKKGRRVYLLRTSSVVFFLGESSRGLGVTCVIQLYIYFID